MADEPKQDEQFHPAILEAFELVRRDVIAYEDGVAFITQDVAFHVFSLVRRLRKNFWGVFENPRDPHSGRQKIWIPLTEIAVDNVGKNRDLDQKDVNFRTKPGGSPETTELIRAKTLDELDKMFFGEKLDEIEQDSDIDGTGIWKITDAPSGSGRLFDIQRVDRLNFYIDTNAHSIQEAFSIVERAVLTPDQVLGMTGWDNVKDIQYYAETPPSDRMLTNRMNMGSSAKYAEIFERWGTMPSYLIPNTYGSKQDQENPESPYSKSPKMIEGHIVVANVFKAPTILLIEKNTNVGGHKPYEELWSTKVSNRWDGKGAAEKVMGLQIWLNEVINLRRNKNTLAQLGVMKVKKGKGITSQMLQRLASTGTIPVQSMDDIEQLLVAEAGQGSYTDEQTIKTWAKETTSTYEAATGETLPASAPATNAVLQSRSAQSQFQKMKEQFGMFLQRVFDRHIIPRIARSINKGDIIRLSADYDGFEGLVDRVASYYVAVEAESLKARGIIPTPDEIHAAMELARTKLMSDSDLFIETLSDIVKDGCDTKVYITNEEMDVASMTDKLTTALNLAPEYRDFILSQIFDLFGLAKPQKNYQSATQPQLGPDGKPVAPTSATSGPGSTPPAALPPGATPSPIMPQSVPLPNVA